MTKIKLSQLQSANLPCATPDVFRAKVREDAPDRMEAEKQLAVITDYLKRFVPPSNCICCGSKLGCDSIMDLVTGAPTFVYDIQHGEGHCFKCGYPARAMHYIGDPEILTVRNFILQYHPSTLTV